MPEAACGKGARTGAGQGSSRTWPSTRGQGLPLGAQLLQEHEGRGKREGRPGLGAKGCEGPRQLGLLAPARRGPRGPLVPHSALCSPVPSGWATQGTVTPSTIPTVLGPVPRCHAPTPSLRIRSLKVPLQEPCFQARVMPKPFPLHHALAGQRVSLAGPPATALSRELQGRCLFQHGPPAQATVLQRPAYGLTCSRHPGCLERRGARGRTPAGTTGLGL